jgi:hypothetical protein
MRYGYGRCLEDRRATGGKSSGGRSSGTVKEVDQGRSSPEIARGGWLKRTEYLPIKGIGKPYEYGIWSLSWNRDI